MRHAASLLAAMEGISRTAFRIARELANNSRSGLTVRFLSKKLEVPEEEIEYLVDVNHRFLFVDLTKIKIATEGANAAKRVMRGLENRGDVPSIFRHIKSLSAQEFRALEEVAGLEGPLAKKAAAEEIIAKVYRQPDSVVSYVATRNFSPTAREIFDIVWHSKEGVVPVRKIRALHGGTEYEIEQGLSELFNGLALFEMFRFDVEDRLMRAAGLLSEIRQWREQDAGRSDSKKRLRPQKNSPAAVESQGIGFSDRICRLVAAIAAKPARLRGDGELFREDLKRLCEIAGEEIEPSLNTCLWVAQGVGWLARVDNELRAGRLDSLLALDRVARHRIVAEWMLSVDKTTIPPRLLTGLLDMVRPGAWYGTVDVVRQAMAVRAEEEQPVLKCMGGHWQYVSPGTTAHSERAIVRAFEETLLWLGMVDRAESNGNSVFRLTDLGVGMLADKTPKDLAAAFPKQETEIVVQPNFDIVVPGQDMDPLLTVPLDQFADRASTGSATVYHLSKESFTRAIQEGHDGDAFVQYLLEHNRGARFPSNVMTTLEDWRGGMKRVKLRTIQVLECEDSLVMADLLHRRKFKKFFKPVDSRKITAYGKISKAELTKQLEKDGFIVD